MGENPQNGNSIVSRGYLWDGGREDPGLGQHGMKVNALTLCRQASGLPMCLVFKVPPGCLVSYAPHPGHLSTSCVPAISLAPKITAPEPNLA